MAERRHLRDRQADAPVQRLRKSGQRRQGRASGSFGCVSMRLTSLSASDDAFCLYYATVFSESQVLMRKKLRLRMRVFAISDVQECDFYTLLFVRDVL